MTGGQMAPTSIPDEITSTSPLGKNASIFGPAFHGPELVRNIANSAAFIARASVSNPTMIETVIAKAIKNHLAGNFSMIEILSICPTNWKMNAAESFEFLAKLEKIYPLGEIIKNKSVKDSASNAE